MKGNRSFENRNLSPFVQALLHGLTGSSPRRAKKSRRARNLYNPPTIVEALETRLMPSTVVSGAIQELEGLAAQISNLVNSNLGTPLADKLEDVQAKLEIGIVELSKDKPDFGAFIGSMEGAAADLNAAAKDGLLNSSLSIQLATPIIKLGMTPKVVEIIRSEIALPLADKLEDAHAKLASALGELTKDSPDLAAAGSSLQGAIRELETAANDGLLNSAKASEWITQMGDLAHALDADEGGESPIEEFILDFVSLMEEMGEAIQELQTVEWGDGWTATVEWDNPPGGGGGSDTTVGGGGSDTTIGGSGPDPEWFGSGPMITITPPSNNWSVFIQAPVEMDIPPKFDGIIIGITKPF